MMLIKDLMKENKLLMLLLLPFWLLTELVETSFWFFMNKEDKKELKPSFKRSFCFLYGNM